MMMMIKRRKKCRTIRVIAHVMLEERISRKSHELRGKERKMVLISGIKCVGSFKMTLFNGLILSLRLAMFGSLGVRTCLMIQCFSLIKVFFREIREKKLQRRSIDSNETSILLLFLPKIIVKS